MYQLIPLLGLLLILVALITLFLKSDELEPYLLVKLIGYTILGGFTFEWNDWKLPLGFLIFLLFSRNIRINANVKKRAAYIGLLVYLLSTLIPFVETTIFEWPREIELQNTNFYNGSLVEEWENVHNEFSDLEHGVKIKHFKLMMNDEGDLQDIQMDMEENGHPQNIHYRIRLSENDKKLIVKRQKVERVQYYQNGEPPYMQASFFLAQLDLIKKPMLNHKGINSYTLRSDGQRIGFGITDGVNYRIDTAGKHKLEKSELPVNAIIVDVCGSNCSVYEHFLFDVRSSNGVSKSAVLDVASKDSPEVRQWFKEHTGDAIGYEENGEHVLITDGKKKKVTDEEYNRALKETPLIDYQQNENMWQVTVKNPYGEAPHVMRFTLEDQEREVMEVLFE
ncbi:hypothetical protein [Guptibacillus hwajinpoensis]|uniref:Uncharacterized protein n=1 Tax=Guptibacillus hwajinpoensis TaxID=208199 RepID=A0A0J6D1S1_9BACL|nr:hypothetical protein [Alkalihalobacillus macyae]KMM39233.1 hypothetical protein AB986_08425 [Alkalihalobacillus macyae]